MDYPHNAQAIDPWHPLHKVMLACYLLFALGLFFPLCTLVGLIIAYLKREDAAGSDYWSHFTWLIRTFWISLGVAIVGGITLLIGIGALILLALWVWHVYRIVAGGLKLYDRQPIVRPTRLF